MPRFKFQAKKFGGEEIEGVREAEDQFSLARELKEEDYILIDFEEEGIKKHWEFSLPLIGGVPFADRMIFTRNLAVMIGAGLPISRALGVLKRQAKNKKFKKIISNISEDLTRGKSLSESLSAYSPRGGAGKKIFSDLYVAMVKAGEKSGKLQEALKLVAQQMEKEHTLRRKIKGAMIYPAIIVVAMIGIGILMLIFVVPTLISTFEELNVELPLSTRIIVWFSNSLISNSVLIIAGLLIFIIFAVLILRTKKVKNLLDSLFLRLPLLSPLIRKINSARTARTLSSLIDSGVSILEALDVTMGVLQNYHYKNVLKNARVEIQKGAIISAAFRKNEKIFPSLVGEMIAVGEETGKLPEMLLRLADFYEEEVNETTKDMTTIIEPILMIFIGFVVGFFAIAMMRPMYSMMGGI